jgi:hypothetical protein
VSLGYQASPSVVCLLFSWPTYLGFLLREKTCRCAHHTFRLEFPNCLATIIINYTPAIKPFSGAVAGEEVEDLCKGSFSHAHPLLCFIVLLYLFLLASFYIKNPKKIESLIVVFTCLLLVLLKWLILKTPSCTTLLVQTIVILSALLLRHLLLLQTFMRLSLLYRTLL